MNNWVWKPRNNEKRSHTNGIINTAFLFDCLGYVFSDISSQTFFKVKSTMRSPGETSDRLCFEL